MNETIRIYPQNMWTSLLISNERLELTVRNYGVRFGEKKKSAFEKTGHLPFSDSYLAGNIP